MKEEVEYREEKADIIIDAAQKRFAVYGAGKTSMREIAEDLHMSKASLYYYFPDKDNLYKAVIEKEQNEFLMTLEQDVRNNPEPAECLKRYALNRLSYYKKLLNLARVGPTTISEFSPMIVESFRSFREKEKKIIITVLEKGKRTGQFNIKDTYETASLFLEILRGLRSVFVNNKKLVSINDEEFRELSRTVSRTADIFIKGLMYKK